MPTIDLDHLVLPPRRRPWTDGRLWREWCFLRVVGRHFRWRAVALLGVILLGAVAFRQFEGHSLLVGIYFTWSLIFGEPPEDFPEHPVLQALFFIVPVLGLVVILEAIVDFSLIVRDRRRSERSWCMTMAQSYSNHIVLIGLGRLGVRVFKLLRKLGETVVVIESNPSNQFLEEVRRDGAPLFINDGRRDQVLVDANIARARSVICATTDDLANLEIALDAQKMNPDIRVVLRMFDQNMADKLRAAFDIRLAMSQSALSAPSFAMAAVDSNVLNTMVVHDELIVMLRWKVIPDGPLAGRTVADVLREYRFGIVEWLRPGEKPRLYPPPETRLGAGDELIVQGAYAALLALQARDRSALPTT